MSEQKQSPKIATNQEKNDEIILRTKSLTKVFGKLTAVKDLNLELRRGEVFGFLGPNGAGKSTTVGMILGLVTPTSGSTRFWP
jgi:ABC-2 type transport system ATP-binding protein